MRQIITRLDDDLAEALKAEAAQKGESVNAYLTTLIRVAVGRPPMPRQMQKAKAIERGLLVGGRQSSAPGSEPARKPWSRGHPMDFGDGVTTPAGYAASLVSEDRGEL